MVDTLQSLFRKFQGVPERLETNLRNALQVAANEAAHEAQHRHLYIDRTGELTKSIEAGTPRASFSSSTPLYVDVTAEAPHALWIERGTKAHVIRAKSGKSLRWKSGGGYRFARQVNHPGTKPYRFLQDAVDKTLPILTKDLIPTAIDLAFEQAGFKESA